MSSKTTIGLKVSHERNARIERKVDDDGYQSRQSYIRELIDEDLGGWDSTESTTTEHTPDDRRLAVIYETLLEHIPLKGWTRYNSIKGRLAEQTRYSQDNLLGELKPLRRQGYCTIRVLNPIDENPHYEIKVKPPAADPEQWRYRETDDRPDVIGGVPDDHQVDCRKHQLIAAIADGDEDLVDEFDLEEFGLRRIDDDEDDDRLVAPISESEPVIENEVDRISHGTPNSHIETHISSDSSRRRTIEEIREEEELTNDPEAEV